MTDPLGPFVEMFKHQPVAPQPNSADTPPDEDIDISLPPPPSEKKIARQRESTRAVRERSPDSPPMPSSKRLKAGVGAGAGAALSASTSASASASSSLSNAGARSVKPPSRGGGVDPLLTSLSADAGPVKSNGGPRHVDFLTFSISQRPKPSAPTPMSPPRKPRPSRLSMGPPSEPFVRKTRKSMRGFGEDDMSGEAVVPVPEGETPMIRKNRELREAQRRSSLGMRGQRASSSLGRGEISESTSQRSIRLRRRLLSATSVLYKSGVLIESNVQAYPIRPLKVPRFGNTSRRPFPSRSGQDICSCTVQNAPWTRVCHQQRTRSRARAGTRPRAG